VVPAVRAVLVVVLLAVGAPAAGAGTAPHDPVVLVAGTFSRAEVLEPLAARLRADGFDVAVFELPDLGRGDIRASAAALAPFVDGVLAARGASAVDLVGHSQGGLVARDYVKSHGGAAKVDAVIGLGAPNHGTLVSNLASLLRDCDAVVACGQMAVGSAYLAELNAGDDSIGAVRYWQFASRADAVVVPYTTSFLDPGDGAIVNVTIQDRCWLRPVGHVGLILDGAVQSGIRQALSGEPVALDCFAL
jgi:triacylglycerol lipase